jgi:membrane dipeptidase
MMLYNVPMRRILLFLLALAACYGQRKVTDAEVREVHRSALLIDSHNDVTSKTVTGFDIGMPAQTGHTDLPRLREGGVGAVFFAAYVAPTYAKDHTAANRALQMIDTIRHDIVAHHANDFVLALTADDIVAAHKNGKIAALIGIEGGHAIEDSPRLLRDFYALGVRYMTLTHTNTNGWADSSGDTRDKSVQHHNGLTELGKQIIQEMNREGMIVDISHVADKTFWDALETSKVPIFASHSSCRALCNVPRNMTDDMIAALGKKRGVIQINFNCGFLTQSAADGDSYADAREKYKDDPEKLHAALAELRAKTRESRVHATLADVVAHIDHAVKIAGIDAVGIGSDFDGVTCTPEGLDDVSKFPNLTRALLEKGYTAADVRKIYGGNTLRLMREVEKGRMD